MPDLRNYHLKIPEEAFEALQEVAKKDRRLLADVIRIALESYMKEQGYEISFAVERGGYRDRKAKKISEGRD
ncbi:MAG: hypothetical protein H7Y09_11785 [Chitinophagaceae bacterium]|nr:hypothetical protein [Anaerolineae bacterium]